MGANLTRLTRRGEGRLALIQLWMKDKKWRSNGLNNNSNQKNMSAIFNGF